MAGNNRVVTFGTPDSDVYACEVEGTAFRLVTPIGQIDIELKVPGKHNIVNAVNAAAVLFAMGRDLCDIKKGLENFEADRKSTRLNSSHMPKSRMPSSA